MKKRGLLFGMALLMLVGCGRGHHQSGAGTEVGMQPVSYSLPRLGGGHDALGAHRGHVVLLDLWASWCPPCREELPDLSALAKSDKQLVVLAANQGETAEVASGVVRQLHLGMPVLLDRDQQYGAAYATVGLPTAVILDKNGKIAAVETGARSLADWRAIIAKVAAQ